MTNTITYTTGDATIAPPYSIIAHICNNRGGWGAGFTGALSRQYPRAEKHYRECWRKQYLHDLGSVQLSLVDPDIWVVNMIAQDGYSTPGKAAIDYNALQMCLGKLRVVALAHGYTVHMPRIGTKRAGGDWKIIEPMIVAELCERGVGVTVYDLPK